jgi:hypothetical protein
VASYSDSPVYLKAGACHITPAALRIIQLRVSRLRRVRTPDLMHGCAAAPVDNRRNFLYTPMNWPATYWSET